MRRAGWLVWPLAFGLMVLAAGAQAGLAPRVAIGGVEPIFPVVVLAVFGPLLGRPGAMALGFAAGLLQGAAVGVDGGAYAFSRLVAGALLGMTAGWEMERNAGSAALFALAATLVAQVAFLFLAPPSGIGSFLLATIGAAIYNGVLAAALFGPFGRLLSPRER